MTKHHAAFEHWALRWFTVIFPASDHGSGLWWRFFRALGLAPFRRRFIGEPLTLRVGQVSGCQTFAFFKLLETNRLKPSNIQLGATDSSTVRRNSWISGISWISWVFTSSTFHGNEGDKVLGCHFVKSRDTKKPSTTSESVPNRYLPSVGSFGSSKCTEIPLGRFSEITEWELHRDLEGSSLSLEIGFRIWRNMTSSKIICIYIYIYIYSMCKSIVVVPKILNGFDMTLNLPSDFW